MSGPGHPVPALRSALAHLSDAEVDAELRAARARLAVYGTLAPGRANHHVLDPIQPQSWSTGVVRGTLHPEGWGAALGYPALVFDPAGDAVPVHVLESPALPEHWARLDAFEGRAYRRTIAPVTLAPSKPSGPDRIIAASIYLLAGAPP